MLLCGWVGILGGNTGWFGCHLDQLRGWPDGEMVGVWIVGAVLDCR